MPQLDFFSLGNQFFWGLLFFGTFYYVVVTCFIPAIFSLLYARKFYVKGIDQTSYLFVAFLLSHQVLVQFLFNQFLADCTSSVDTLQSSRAISYSVISAVFDNEFKECIYDSLSDYEL